MEITSGRIQKAKKVVIYGHEGIGKSTFAAQFPNALFIDTEGSTNGMDVRRAPKPSSWEMLLSEIREVAAKKLCTSLIIDTIDWAEQLCVAHICAKAEKSGIEDFGYGKGYTYEKEEFGKLLNLLSDVVDGGINVVLTAHAQLKKFEQPDEMGAYDRWELKLGAKTGSQISPLVKEWADMVLFASYKTFAVAVDKDGKKCKAQGGERVMYTSHHPCWDAKNRDGLSSELPFAYSGIAHLFSQNASEVQTKQAEPEKQKPPVQPSVKPSLNLSEFEEILPSEPNIPEYVPKPLADLMRASNVSEQDVQLVVSQRGYYPKSTTIDKYDQGFVSGCLVAAWNQILPIIRENQQVPF